VPAKEKVVLPQGNKHQKNEEIVTTRKQVSAKETTINSCQLKNNHQLQQASTTAKKKKTSECMYGFRHVHIYKRYNSY
jgi:hypothetical protein